MKKFILSFPLDFFIKTIYFRGILWFEFSTQE